ncbi:major facilitator superfamily domain-containing protein 1-like isoform X4 [Gordionus sp. m RMFG-2023]|uniref:major facilitator superfamily domain-containing protein 1-like isoform X4 n=1 Tax=Gordionus sp. m RMFG-2023 TaxID=3053472 RepID=UPI0031FD88EF
MTLQPLCKIKFAKILTFQEVNLWHFIHDKVFGIRFATFLFAGLVLIGNIIFSIGAFLNAYWLMCIGRFVFGVGGESLAVAQNFFAILWFKGKEINLVFGLQLSVSRLGSTVSFNALVPIYFEFQKYLKKTICLGATFMLVTLTCLLSFVSALLLIYMDRRAEKLRNSSKLVTHANNEATMERNKDVTNENQDNIVTNKEDKAEKVSIKDIKDFPLNVWLINIVCVTYYVALFTFIGLGIPFFQNKFGLSLARASVVNSIVYIISAFISPILGFVVDKVGRNLTWITISFLFAIVAHSLMAFTLLANPYFCMVLLGISYSILASALWPLVSYEVPAYQLGTAYGLFFKIYNKYQKNASFYEWGISTLFPSSRSSVGLLANAVLQMNDKFRRGVLDVSPAERELKLTLHPTSSASTLLSSNRLNPQRKGDDNPDSLLSEDNQLPLDSNPDNMGCHSQGSGVQGGYHLFPRSSFYIRNRYLSRIGAQIPRHILMGCNKPITSIPYHGGIYQKMPAYLK